MTSSLVDDEDHDFLPCGVRWPKYSPRGPVNLKKDDQAYLQGINKGIRKSGT